MLLLSHSYGLFNGQLCYDSALAFSQDHDVHFYELLHHAVAFFLRILTATWIGIVT